MIGAVAYAITLWWVEMKLTHRAIKETALRAAAATPVPLAISYAVWSGSAPLAITTLFAHATVVGWRFWQVWGFADPPFAFAITGLAVGLNALLVFLLF